MPINQDTVTRYTGGVNFPTGTQEDFRVYVDSDRNLKYGRNAGTTRQRPDSPPLGHPYWDTDLGELIVWDGADWGTAAEGAVESFNGRSGAVVPAQDDYAISDITGLVGELGALGDLDALPTAQLAMGTLRPDGAGGLRWVRTHGTFAQRPSSPAVGQDYYDTGLKTWIIWDGTQWRQVVDSYPVTKSLIGDSYSTGQVDLVFDSAPTKGAGNLYKYQASDDALIATVDVASATVNGNTLEVTPGGSPYIGTFYLLADPGVIVGWCGLWHKSQLTWTQGG